MTTVVANTKMGSPLMSFNLAPSSSITPVSSAFGRCYFAACLQLENDKAEWVAYRGELPNSKLEPVVAIPRPVAPTTATTIKYSWKHWAPRWSVVLPARDDGWGLDLAAGHEDLGGVTPARSTTGANIARVKGLKSAGLGLMSVCEKLKAQSASGTPGPDVKHHGHDHRSTEVGTTAVATWNALSSVIMNDPNGR